MAGRLLDYIAQGLEADLPDPASMTSLVVDGAAVFYYSQDTKILRVLNQDTDEWDEVGSTGSGGTLLGITQLHLPADFNIATGDWHTPDTWVADHDNLGAYTSGDDHVVVPAGVAYARVSAHTVWSSGSSSRAVVIVGDNLFTTASPTMAGDVRGGINETISDIQGQFYGVTPGDFWYAGYNSFTSAANLAGASGSVYGRPCRVLFEWYSDWPI